MKVQGTIWLIFPTSMRKLSAVPQDQTRIKEVTHKTRKRVFLYSKHRETRKCAKNYYRKNSSVGKIEQNKTKVAKPSMLANRFGSAKIKSKHFGWKNFWKKSHDASKHPKEGPFDLPSFASIKIWFDARLKPTYFCFSDMIKMRVNL